MKRLNNTMIILLKEKAREGIRGILEELKTFLLLEKGKMEKKRLNVPKN
ncbi:hypothetical protein ACQKIC_01985 [Peribacillus sp. NPDC046944]